VTLAARAAITSRKAFVGSLCALNYCIAFTVCQPLQSKQVILLAQYLFYYYYYYFKKVTGVTQNLAGRKMGILLLVTE